MQKLVPHRSLALTFEPFRIWLRIRGDTRNRKLVWESFFDYEYLREFEAKIGTIRNVVYWTYAEPVFANTPEPVLLNVYGAPALIPRNEFRQPM